MEKGSMYRKKEWDEEIQKERRKGIQYIRTGKRKSVEEKRIGLTKYIRNEINKESNSKKNARGNLYRKTEWYEDVHKDWRTWGKKYLRNGQGKVYITKEWDEEKYKEIQT